MKRKGYYLYNILLNERKRINNSFNFYGLYCKIILQEIIDHNVWER